MYGGVSSFGLGYTTACVVLKGASGAFTGGGRQRVGNARIYSPVVVFVYRSGVAVIPAWVESCTTRAYTSKR